MIINLIKNFVGIKKQNYKIVKAKFSEDTFDFFAVHDCVDVCISNDIERNGQWEPFETSLFRKLCKSEDIVLDIGANIGWYSVLFSKILSKNGKVLAFEPDSTNYNFLSYNVKNLDTKKNVRIYNFALGEFNSNAVLYKSEKNLGDHRLFQTSEDRKMEKIKVKTLDSLFIMENKWPDIVKSDTQGFEFNILNGAKKLFQKGWKPLMLLEFWPFGLKQTGCDPYEFYLFLKNMNYEMFEVSEDNPHLVRMSDDRLLRRLNADLAPETEYHINILCIPFNSDRFNSISDLILEEK